MDKFYYAVDNIYIDEENHFNIYLNGWFFHIDGLSYTVKCVAKNNKTVECGITNIERSDVNRVFLDYQVSKKCGFDIKLTNFSIQDTLQLFFITDGTTVCSYTIKPKQLLFKQKLNKLKSHFKWLKLKYFKATAFYLQKIGIKATIKKINDKLKNQTQQMKSPQNEIYQFEEIIIPEDWIDIQTYKPTFAFCLAIKDLCNRRDLIVKCLDSIKSQQYNNFSLHLVVEDSESAELIRILNAYKEITNHIIVVENHSKSQFHMLKELSRQIKEDYIVFIRQEDFFSPYLLSSYLEKINLKLDCILLYVDEDHYINDVLTNPIQKRSFSLNIQIFLYSCCISNEWSKQVLSSDINEVFFSSLIDDMDESKIIHIDRVLYHKTVISNAWSNNHIVKAIALYLPQFHITGENNKWWGEGFTEWTNVKRAIPMFEGHRQPRVSEKLGYYDLVEQKNIQNYQATLAKEYGIYGFCYYYYWFNGKRLLHKPLDQIMEKQEIDLPFCICWANENWTKRWDGLNEEILMEQNYDSFSDEEFINDIIPIITDIRYIKVDEAPILLVYKIHLLPNPKERINSWRKIAKKSRNLDLHIIAFIHPETKGCQYYGVDALAEFPPHDMNCENITEDVKRLNKKFEGAVYDYAALAEQRSIVEKTTEPTYRSCMLQWDNTARRMNKSSVFHRFELEFYEKWLLSCKDYAYLCHTENQRFVFINAWNEWAEGTYLEPDQDYGLGYLESTKKILQSQ